MSCKFDFVHHFGRLDVVTSSYWHLNLKIWILYFTLYLTMFVWLYLFCFDSIFCQIVICCSWDCALQELYTDFFFLDDGMIRWWSDPYTLRSTYCFRYEIFILSHHFLLAQYLKNCMNNHVEICHSPFPLWGIKILPLSSWSLIRDAVQAPFCIFLGIFVNYDCAITEGHFTTKFYRH